MAWIHFLSARAAGAIGNAQILARALNDNILEDEEGNENDSLSDDPQEGSEGSEGSGGDNGNEDEHGYPLRDSWNNEAVRCGRLLHHWEFFQNSLLLEMALVKHMI